jgi:hypothetical protein
VTFTLRAVVITLYHDEVMMVKGPIASIVTFSDVRPVPTAVEQSMVARLGAKLQAAREALRRSAVDLG